MTLRRVLISQDGLLGRSWLIYGSLRWSYITGDAFMTCYGIYLSGKGTQQATAHDSDEAGVFSLRTIEKADSWRSPTFKH